MSRGVSSTFFVSGKKGLSIALSLNSRTSLSSALTPSCRVEERGFTLIELLMVIVIIGVLASMGLPALKGIGRSNLVAAAHRQILDDLALARLRAINGRSTVYFVFAPVTLGAQLDQKTAKPPRFLQGVTNLIPLQYSGYAMVANRSLGDQPGRSGRRYLSDWKRLPDGFVFAPFKFDVKNRNATDPNLRSFPSIELPFPTGSSDTTLEFPYIAFNAQGQLIRQTEETIPLARGTVMIPRDQNGFAPMSLTRNDVILTPPPRSTNDYQYVSINWLTGRARAQSPTVP